MWSKPAVKALWSLALAGFLSTPGRAQEVATEAADGLLPVQVVEGSIRRMDARLAPTLREGLIFSAQLRADFATVLADEDEAPAKARFRGLEATLEAAFDRNHVWQYGVRAEAVELQLELDEAAELEDGTFALYSLVLPVEGEPIGADAWTPRWLQLWYYGESEAMLERLEVQPPPAEFARGWWRLTFWRVDGAESISAEGWLTLSGPAGEALSPSGQIAQLESLVADLGSRLNEAENVTARLEDELITARRRIDGLQRTMDVLIEERRLLQEELERWRAEGSAAPEALQERIGELEAQVVLNEEAQTALEAENRALADALVQAQAALSAATAARPAPVPVVAPPEPKPLPEAGVVLVPSPPVVEETAIPIAPPTPAAPVAAAEVADTVELEPEPEVEPEPEPVREVRVRPGKFGRHR